MERSQANGFDDGRYQYGLQRIADIIGVVDSIALQTNTLALNAAAEDARAGGQGGGFAVNRSVR